MSAKTHWEHIYETKAPNQVSWFQEHANLSLDLIQRTGTPKTGPMIDVGGGASVLVENLLDAGYTNLTVLDISRAALQTARQSLGPRGDAVTWLSADITHASLPAHTYDLWHDRAVFHFLTLPADRARYVQTVRRTVRPGGHVIVATFASDGPTQCSGLDVMRYDRESLHDEFGEDFKLMDSVQETHHTPFGTEQKFVYCYCRKEDKEFTAPTVESMIKLL